MDNVVECSRCGALYARNAFRDVCPKCYRSEEELYQVVYNFLRKRENRAATMERIEEVTGATPSLIHKWVRKGRLQPAMFPNLGYPCDRCGRVIQAGKLCSVCVEDIESDLSVHEREKEFAEEKAASHQRTYFGKKD